MVASGCFGFIFLVVELMMVICLVVSVLELMMVICFVEVAQCILFQLLLI